MQDLIERIEQANRTAAQRIIDSKPMLIDVRIAGEWIEGMKENDIFHSGPPIAFKDMCDSQKGAVIGAVLYEGLAKDAREAEALCLEGAINLSPNHHHNGVGGMAGVISRSTPLYIFKDATHGHYSYAGCLTERLIFGGYDQKTMEDIRWTNEVLAPSIGAAIRASGGLDIKSVMAKGIHMGDELHNRGNAATAELIRQLFPWLVESEVSRTTLKAVSDFLAVNDQYFLFIGYGACKSMMMSAENIEYCSLITAMSRNGVSFGIRVSGLGDEWFTGAAGLVQGPTFPGFKQEDGEKDIGDSSITETAGLGAFIMAGAPAILRIIGGTVSQARNYTENMYRITETTNPNFSVPVLDFRGAPIGIDIRKVVESGIIPVLDTAMTHVKRGVGEMIGAGIVKLPMDPFEKAFISFGEKYIHAPEPGIDQLEGK